MSTCDVVAGSSSSGESKAPPKRSRKAEISAIRSCGDAQALAELGGPACVFVVVVLAQPMSQLDLFLVELQRLADPPWPGREAASGGRSRRARHP